MALLLLLLPPMARAQTPVATSLAAGYQHTVVVKSDGTVWAFGDNGSGQLGDNTTTIRRVPQVVPGLANVVAVAAGTAHSLALTSSGTVYAWGNNTNGSVGDGTTTQRKTPVALSLTSVVAVAAGDYHSLALGSNGDVYVWGRNSSGQIGNGTTTNVTSPWLLTTGAQAVGAGGTHTLVVKTDGTVWATGSNTNGQLADGTTTQRTALVQAAGLSGIVDASGGAKHSVFLLTDGTMMAAGLNSSGQLGDGTTIQRTTAVTVSGASGIAAIDAGANHTLAAAADGSLSAWGDNTNGGLGDGTTTDRTAPALIASVGAVAGLSAGQAFSVAVTPSGYVWVAGKNNSSQLGDGATTDLWVPVSISGADFAWRVATPTFSVAPGTYTSDRTVVVSLVTTGATIHYTQNGAEPTEEDPVVASGGSLDVKYTLVLKAKAWKSGLPTGNAASAAYTMKVALPSVSPGGGTYTTAKTVTLSTSTQDATLRYTLDGTEPTSASPAYASPLVIGTTTTLKVVGFRDVWSDSDVRAASYTMSFGTLTAPSIAPGPGTFTGQVLVTLEAQPFATIRYTINGGTPTTGSPLYTAPVPVDITATVRAKAFHPDYTASAVTTESYTLVASTPVFSLASGSYAPGTAVTVSSPDAGATLRWTLDGTDPTSSSPVLAPGALLVSDYTVKIRAFRPNANDSAVASATYTLTAPLSGGGVSAGDRHTLVTTPEGMLYAWGYNTNSQIGDGSATTRPTPVLVPTLTGVVGAAAGGLHSLAVTADGQLWTWGYNGYGRLGDGTTTNRTRPVPITGVPAMIAVAAGASHSLALGANGLVYAFGAGDSGQLGQGSTAWSSVPVLVSGLVNVVAIAAGGSHSLAATASGQVYAWGLNSASQLGDGTTGNRLVPTLVSGVGEVVGVTAGSAHSLVRTRSGGVWAWGSGSGGKLGLGDQVTHSTPVQVSSLSAAVLAAGTNHSGALSVTGALLGWGTNTAGQVGDGTTTMALSPTSVPGPAGVTTLALGGSHSVAVALDGGVWAWGSGSGGKLGLGDQVTHSTPVLVPGLSTAVLAAGTNHSGALSLTGALLGWGANTAGQVGDGTTTMALSPTSVPGPAGVTTLALGGSHSVAVALDGGVWTWGQGIYSQLGDGTTTNRPTAAQVWTAPGRWSPPPPMLSLATGTYASEQIVLITSAAPGATLRYTTTGADPTESDPEVPTNGDVLITAPTTLKARAWVPDRTPSPVAAATYTLQPAAPTVTPGTGTYVGPQSVTLGSGDPQAALRYTVDGSTPGETSTIYTGPIAVGSTTTVQARAFRAGWMPSGTTTAVLTLNQGTLATPTATPPAGAITPQSVIAVDGPSGATLRYTTDGSEPTGSSTIYTGPIAAPAGVSDLTIKAAAFQAGWTPSATLTAAYTIDSALPTIQASVVPAAINGWHHTPPTVSFVCSDVGSGVASCPESVVVSTDGSGQVVEGTVYDAAGNAGATTVTINLDRVPPSVEIIGSTPSSSPTVATDVAVQATVADALSGIFSAHCNGLPATISSGTVECSVPLRKGRNAVIVDTVDQAGNSSSASFSMSRVDTPTALSISPNSLILLVGDERVVQVLDDYGQPAPGGLSWVADDPSVAEVESRPEGPTVVAHALGETDITVSVGSLEQTLHVTILTGTTIPVGTMAWTSLPAGGASTQSVALGTPDRDGTTVLALEEDPSGGSVRAVGPLGHTKWQAPIPGSETPAQAFGLADGGVVLRTGSSILRLAHPEGGPAWRFPGSVSAMGRTPNGNIVALLHTDSPADTELVSLDGDSGAVRWRHALPRSPGSVTLNIDCSIGYDSYGDDTAAAATALTIDELGTTYLYLTTGSGFFDYASGGQCEMYHREESGALALMKVTETGAASTPTLRTYAISQTAPASSFELPPYTVGIAGTMTPIAGGGVVASRTDAAVGGGVSDTILTTYDTSASFTNHYGADVTVVADAEAGHVVIDNAGQLEVVNVSSGATTATYSGDLVEVLADNEVLVAQGGQLEHRDASGGLMQTGAVTLQGAVRVAQAIWAQVDHEFGSGLGGVYGLSTSRANALVPFSGVIALPIRYPALPVVRNLTDLDVVVKNGGCYARFGTVPAHRNYYRWVDGVMPGAVTGWNAGDWFKVPDLSLVVVHPNGAQPTAFGPFTWTCRQDDPSQSDYDDCWGRRIEPDWSKPSTPENPGGRGHIDWKYPREISDFEACGPYPKPWNIRAWW